MPDRKLSQLPETTNFAGNDIIPLVDTSETQTKKIQISNLLVDQITPDERTKLAGIADGATANQTDAHLLNRDNHVGTIPASVISDFNTVVDARIAGSNLIITSDERTKLAGVAEGATANQTDAHLLNRDNHTGTQTAASISDFNTAVDTRISSSNGAGHGSGSVTLHNDVSSAGSGAIITTAERTAISNLGTASTKNVASSGDASDAQVVKGDDSRLTDARTPRLAE